MFSKKATFWLAVISILICLNNYLGNDDKNILLIGLNPVLNSIVYTEPFRHWILDFESAKLATDSATIRVLFPAYIIHFASVFFIGKKYHKSIRPIWLNWETPE
ncbi:hypothetical protein [Paenibacillus oleatilyticus]|uniref:hypothetical protein n=1 Tax=Paenibacillus oleatilyticus TaxID=2594886 RepID=UPI002803B298|nr:hypothetical protein [Paenibacillus oleatilyticus]